MRSQLVWGSLGLATAVGLVLLAGCPAGYQGLCDNGACDASDAAPDACDPQASNCLDPSKGLFVSPSGNDSSDGSQQSPLKTIGAALTKANGAGMSRIYICAGSYAENLAVQASIALLGGFSCSDWSYAASNAATVDPASGLPLHVANATVSVSDLKFVAADAANPGDSSVAAFVDTATVNLLRVGLSAGKGQGGDVGTLGSYTFPAQADLNGNAADGGTGGAAKTVNCPAGDTTTGGKGGDNGFDGDPGLPALDGGAGGTGALCQTNNQGGGNGGIAPIGTNATTTSVLGNLTGSGWAASDGSSGAAGGCGQGGGGGAGRGGGGGGGGGAGGCGGAGGGGGQGGGGSIALAALSSTVTVNASTLSAMNAGNGGAGVAGQAGQTIYGFGGLQSPPGCGGGNGGTGGAGGSGAGGAGGVSVGVLWKGTAAPTLDSATTSAITVGTKGTQGAGGSPGTNDGIAGVAQAVLQVQ